jgi:predicted amidohydrolase YtcJ
MADRKILINGKFYNPEPGSKAIQAIAVEDGIIIDVGSNAKIKPLSRRGFDVCDLKKRCVITGIIDSHLHLLALGNLFKRVDLDSVNSLDRVAAILEKAVSTLKKGQWLQGRGWNKNLWGDDFPGKNLLDAITGNPVALYSKDGHLLWVSSSTLEYCGIDSNTPDPPGGVILRDTYGNPTGVLKENAVDLVSERIPSQSYEEKTDSLIAAQKHLLKLGIVAVGDCDTRSIPLLSLRELDLTGRLHMRIFKMIHPDDLEMTAKLDLQTGMGSDRFRIGCLKLFADGALGSQTAYMFKPYNQSKNNYGVETLTEKDMEKYVSRAVKAGISVAVHAIGDKANYQVLKLLGKYAAAFSEKGLRPRIEHAQILKKKDIPGFKEYGVIASVQPIHVTSDRDISDRYLGARARNAYPFKSLLKSGVELAFGSDAPIEKPNPMAGIHAAVTRKRPDETRKAWYPEEKITRRQALRAYTLGAARACCYDDLTGSTTVGKRADLAVLSDDIFETRTDNIHRIEVLATIMDGKVVFGRRNLDR